VTKFLVNIALDIDRISGELYLSIFCKFGNWGYVTI